MAQQQDKAGNNIIELEEGEYEPPQPPEEDAEPPVILAPRQRVRHGFKSVGGIAPRLQLRERIVEIPAAENKEEEEEEELEADNENKKRKRKN
jgi:hypothetical protein